MFSGSDLMDRHFRGWYFKCQSPTQTLALIPAVHTCRGCQTGSIQVVTEKEHWNVPFSGESCLVRWDRPLARLEQNRFSSQGIDLHLHSDHCHVEGQLRFGPPTPLSHDIMGPFRFVPFLECRHRVFSMRHQVMGQLLVNGEPYRFDHDLGYIEGDQGRSFPRRYLWTQCLFPNGSLMLSAADIPLGPFSFPGVIAALSFSRKVIILATYCGAKIISVQNGKITVKQNNLLLTAELLSDQGLPLRAPQGGSMSRTIRENVSCHARYCLFRNGEVLWAGESRQASFEYEYPS